MIAAGRLLVALGLLWPLSAAARLMVGPSVQFGGPSRKWRVTVGGGPVFHATTSGRSSTASRELPLGAGGTGFAVQSSFAYLF